MPRQKKCRACGIKFEPYSTLDRACSPPCALKVVEQDKAKAQRKETKRRKEAIKTRSELLKEAQAAFNWYIRERDAGKPCICCGRYSDDGNLITGSRWDAGHYRSVGAAPHLRFNEDNCHKQLVKCNRFLSSNAIEYRKGLIERIGEARVQALENDDSTRNYTQEDLRELRDYYRAKTRELRRAQESD